MPPLIWDCEVVPSIELRNAAISAGLNWLIVPLSKAIDILTASDLRAIVRLDIEDAVGTPSAKLKSSFASLDRPKVAGVMLCGATGGDIKAGRAFHRLATLRDAGLCDAILIEATDHASAEWLVENTPVSGISIPFDVADQTAKYRVLDAAEALGISVLARASVADQSEADTLLRVDDRQVVASIEAFPKDLESLHRVRQLLEAPIDAQSVAAQWNAFKKRVPEPAKPRGQHPPEFEA